MAARVSLSLECASFFVGHADCRRRAPECLRSQDMVSKAPAEPPAAGASILAHFLPSRVSPPSPFVSAALSFQSPGTYSVITTKVASVSEQFSQEAHINQVADLPPRRSLLKTCGENGP